MLNLYKAHLFSCSSLYSCHPIFHLFMSPFFVDTKCQNDLNHRGVMRPLFQYNVRVLQTEEKSMFYLLALSSVQYCQKSVVSRNIDSLDWHVRGYLVLVQHAE